METTGSPVSALTAFAVSIALPPPRATSPSAPAAAATASSTVSLGTCWRQPAKRPAAGRSSWSQRRVVTRSGRSIPSSASSSG